MVMVPTKLETEVVERMHYLISPKEGVRILLDCSSYIVLLTWSPFVCLFVCFLVSIASLPPI